MRPFYFLPAAFLRAAQRAFMDSESFRRPAAVRPRRFLPLDFAVGAGPPDLRRASQRAFIASERRRRPAAVKPRVLREAVLVAAAPALLPLRRAQRARAAAANLARVAGDIGPRRRPRPRRRPPPLFRPLEAVELPPKRLESRSSKALICCLRESACDSLLRDRSMASSR